MALGRILPAAFCLSVLALSLPAAAGNGVTILRGGADPSVEGPTTEAVTVLRGEVPARRLTAPARMQAAGQEQFYSDGYGSWVYNPQTGAMRACIPRRRTNRTGGSLTTSQPSRVIRTASHCSLQRSR